MKATLTRARKIILLITVLAIVSGVIVLTVWGRKTETGDYFTAKIERGAIHNTVSAIGALQAVKTVLVGSQVSGTIKSLLVDYNSTVKIGQIVAQLDPAILQAQVTQAQANLEAARASLADAQARLIAAQDNIKNQQAGVVSFDANLAALKAQSDDAKSFLTRQQVLADKGLITQRDLESASNSYQTALARYNQAKAQLDQARVTSQSASVSGLASARAQVQQAQAQVQQNAAALQLAQVNLSHTTITSPVNGVVISRSVDVGQTVAASLQAPTIFTIATDLTKMQVLASIDQADIGVINAAENISFTVDSFPGQTFRGKINQIRLDAQNVQGVVTYNVLIDVDNPELKLKPAMTANLTVTVAESANVLKVPNAALRFTPQGITPDKVRELLGLPPKTVASPNPSNSPQSNPAKNNDGSPKQGQHRIVWVLGADKQPQPKRITLGITDGVTTELKEGDLKEGDLLITGQNITAKPQGSAATPLGSNPNLGGGPRR